MQQSRRGEPAQCHAITQAEHCHACQCPDYDVTTAGARGHL